MKLQIGIALEKELMMVIRELHKYDRGRMVVDFAKALLHECETRQEPKRRLHIVEREGLGR